MLDRAEQDLFAAERKLADAEQHLGSPGQSFEVAVEELKHAQVHAILSATKCMALAARLLVTTRHEEDT